MNTFRRIAAVVIAALILPLAACSATAESSDSVSVTNDVALIPESIAGDGGVSGSATDGAASLVGQRSIVRTGSATIEVSQATAAVDEIGKIASRLGGSVVSQTVSNDGGALGSGDVTIRVPADELDAAFDALAQLGEVRNENRTADDVTEQHVDLRARVDALTAAVDRLTELMADAATTSDLLEAERALSERQQELDGLKAQLTSLEGQIEEATIWVSVHEASALPGGGPKSFWDAVQLGFSSLGAFAAGAVLAIGIALPWVVVVTAIAAAIVLPIRSRRKRSRRRTE